MSETHDLHIRENYEAFMTQLPQLVLTQHGKFALMHNKEIIAFFDTARDAYKVGQKLFPDQIFSIQEVRDTYGCL